MYKNYVSWQDLILVPLYFLVLYFFMLIIKKRNKENPLYQKYLIKGFVFKIACTILYCLLVYYYWGMGDSIHYFKNTLYVHHLINIRKEDFHILFQNEMYLADKYSLDGTSTSQGWLLERMTFLLGYLSFFRFVTTSMLFATIAYSGMFKMFEAFTMLMPKWDKPLSFAVLFFPTVAIYGSGILKDAVCIAAMGWLIYCNNQLFINHKIKVRYIIMMTICAFLVFQIKAYIILAFFVPYIIFLIMMLVNKIKNIFFRRLFFPLLILMLTLLYNFNAASIDNLLGRFAIEKLFDNIKEQQQSYFASEESGGGSSFNIGTIEPTMSGFIKKMPTGINATLFRPYLWESKNFLMIFSAMESLILLLITVWILLKTGFFRFFKTIFNDPFVFLFVTFSLIFAAIIGLSTSNFGTLGRYRIPIVPFYLAGILFILYKKKFISQKTPHEKTE